MPLLTQLHRAAALLRRPLGCTLAALALGCTAARTTSTVRELPLESKVGQPGLLFEVQYSEPDADDADRISHALLKVGPRLQRWGEFKSAVLIRLYPSHAALEEALSLRGYPWLRAWAWSDQIALQSPRSWDPLRDEVPDNELEELLAHELTHALMYQLIETAAAPARREPPLWFREGMASVTAGQGHRRLGPAQLARWVSEHPGIDLLRPAPETYRTEKEAVYGAAHRAFELLLQKSGERGVRDILQASGEGKAFEAAFEKATGRRVEDFEKESVRKGFDSRIAREATMESGAGGP
jgi:hypothetical protein